MLRNSINMDSLNQFGLEYEGVITLLGSLFGLIGVMFGVWRYLKERAARRELDMKKGELKEALSRLKHLETFASELKQYSKVM